jgi:hypothetical protein
MDAEFQQLVPHMKHFYDAVRIGNNDKIVEFLAKKGYTVKSVLLTTKALEMLEKKVMAANSPPPGLLSKIRLHLKRVGMLQHWITYMNQEKKTKNNARRKSINTRAVTEMNAMIKEFQQLLLKGVKKAGQIHSIRGGKRNNLNLNNMNSLGQRMATLNLQIKNRVALLSPNMKKKYQKTLYNYETMRIQGNRLFDFVEGEIQGRHKWYTEAYTKVKLAVLAVERQQYAAALEYLDSVDLSSLQPLDFTFINPYMKFRAKDIQMLRREIKRLRDMILSSSSSKRELLQGQFPLPTTVAQEEVLSDQIREYLITANRVNLLGPGVGTSKQQPVLLIAPSTTTTKVTQTSFPSIVLFLAVMSLIGRFLSGKSRKRIVLGASSVNANVHMKNNNNRNTASSSRKA